MTFFKSEKGKILIAILASVLSLCLLLAGGCALYLADYYKTDKEQSGRLCAELSSSEVERTILSDGTLLFVPPRSRGGLHLLPRRQGGVYRLPAADGGACRKGDLLSAFENALQSGGF